MGMMVAVMMVMGMIMVIKKCVSATGALATTKLGQRQWQGFFSSNYANSNFH